ncbi:esterase-like activity of phytase family protein [Propylenella binzhouense]|uniref:Esterase-like activity of phytase family protein n=1 Tax=Propylenella binzhouense TaxID=2555902 RepID=A0A964WU68_9HYPH|nr:esterase-like activity of phytase family protein [Propylenella binzhouense]MYZ48724.1 esterase-like activity of phytase family protein [Propylenella binzhouense]
MRLSREGPTGLLTNVLEVIMRSSALLAAVSALLASAAANAETLIVYQAAPGQDVLKLPRYQSSVAGAKALDIDVGIGSAAFRDPKDPANVFWTVSDRGPNFTCDEAVELMGVAVDAICPAAEGLKAGAGRVYPAPDYTVTLYQVTLDPASKTYKVTAAVPLKTPKGKAVSGLTNPLKVAKTDMPRDGEGKPLAQDPNSIDAEGLVRLPDGRFFIGEENATGIAEIAPDGTIVRRFVPAGTEQDFAAADYPVTGSLPAILAKRQSNRGIEALALGDDGRTLFAMVQNPLANPDSKAYGDAINTRLLAVEVGSDAGATTLTPVGEYVYRLDDWKHFAELGASDAKKPSSLRVSEMTALGRGHFLVDERTDEVAKLFEISLDGATNILGSRWDDPATAPSLEQVELEAAEIVPVGKTERLVASSLEGANPRYPGKVEGLAMTADGDLMIVNDNDFGIAGAATEIVIVKDGGLAAR